MLAVEPGTGRQVVGRGETPLVLRRQQEREIFAVIVAVAALYVEDHPPDHFLHIGMVTGQSEGELQQIFVIQRGIAMRGVKQSASGVDMDFALRRPVETADLKETIGERTIELKKRLVKRHRKIAKANRALLMRIEDLKAMFRSGWIGFPGSIQILKYAGNIKFPISGKMFAIQDLLLLRQGKVIRSGRLTGIYYCGGHGLSLKYTKYDRLFS